MDLFTINCLTCRCRLKVIDPTAVGRIVACPKCGSMVPVQAPAGWKPPAVTESNRPAVGGEVIDSATAVADAASTLPFVAPTKTASVPSTKGGTPAKANHRQAVPPLPAKLPGSADRRKVAPAIAIMAVADSGLDLANPNGAALATAGASGKFPIGGRGIAAGGAVLSVCLLAVGGWWLTRPPHLPAEPLLPAVDVTTIAIAASPRVAERVETAEISETEETEFDEIVLQVLDEQTEPGESASGVEVPDNADTPADQPDEALDGDSEPQPDEVQLAAASVPRVDETTLPAAAEPESPALRRASFSLRPVDVQARLQDRIARFRCQQLPLPKFVDLVSQFSTVAITLDVDSIADAGTLLDAAVTVDLRDATVAEWLQAALEPLNLGYTIVGDQLVVGDGRADRQQAITQRYDVKAIASDDKSIELVKQTVQRIVLPDTWREEGEGQIETDGHVLVVTHLPAAQRRIADLLDRWKSASLLSSSVVSGSPAAGQSNGSAKTRLLLARPCSITFHRPTPLPRVLKQLEAVGDVRLLVDWQSLHAAGIPPTVEGVVTATDQPLAAVLETLLLPMDAGCRVVAPGVLQIASRTDLQNRLDVEFHSVGDLAANAAAGEELAARLKAELSLPSAAPASPSAGALSYDPTSRSILAHQPFATQLRIAALLEQWRVAAEKR